jgi:maltose phosphorylase
MKEGYLKRSFHAKTAAGKEVAVEATRFCSMVDDECGAIKYAITPVNFSGEITITPFIDGDIANKDSNYDEKFWDEVIKELRTISVQFSCAQKRRVLKCLPL